MLLPPDDVPPERLFQYLLRRPRPWLDLTYRSPIAPDVQLKVVALRGAEESEALDAVQELKDEEARWRTMMTHVVSRALRADGCELSVEELNNLDDTSFDELAEHVVNALRVVSPTYGRCDWQAWETRLKIGADHPRNISDTVLLGASVSEYGERPDLFFGLPLADLTDGHLFAYRAAKRVVEKLRDK